VVLPELFQLIAVVVAEIQLFQQLPHLVALVVAEKQLHRVRLQVRQLHQLQLMVEQQIKLLLALHGNGEEAVVEVLVLEELKLVEMEPLLITREHRLVTVVVEMVVPFRMQEPILLVPRAVQTPVMVVVAQPQAHLAKAIQL
jgi:hypothetical protein